MKILRITLFSFIVGIILSIIIFLISPMNNEFHVSAINIASAIYLYSIITVIILVIQAILLFLIKTSDKISFLLLLVFHLLIILILYIVQIQTNAINNPIIYISVIVISIIQIIIYIKKKSFKN